MMLYHCPTCGRWQDVSAVKIATDLLASLAKALDQPSPEQLGYPCPAGHGLMIEVKPEDRMAVRPAVVEAEENEALYGFSGDRKADKWDASIEIDEVTAEEIDKSK